MIDILLASIAFSAEQVGALVAVLLGGAGLGVFGGKKLAETRVTNDPLKIAQHEFVPRREFDAFRADVRSDFKKMHIEMTRMSERVENKHLELLATIERAAKIGMDGRVMLWGEVNAQGKQIAALEKSVDVEGRLQRIDKLLKERGGES